MSETGVAASARPPGDAPGIHRLLTLLVEMEGSDLHLSEGSAPILRVDGRLEALDMPPLSADYLRDSLREILEPDQLERFTANQELDFSYTVPSGTRFRGNAFVQSRGLSAVFRAVRTEIPSAEDLGLPQVVRDFARLIKGLVLFTGPAGVGKSTTLAALIDLINETRQAHIITIEEPIEFLHTNKRALVHQREVGLHTRSFAAALRAALREDPDVILVGEMRDPETIAIGLTAAETGHLVLGTMHTTSAHKTIDRIIDSFPAAQQGQVRSMLAESLRAVVAQRLLRRRDTAGRVPAFEIMLNNQAIANLIREGRTFQIPSAIQTGGKKTGMVLMDESIRHLLAEGLIDPREAAAYIQDRGTIEGNL
jgi:twitching motility protein PilT